MGFEPPRRGPAATHCQQLPHVRARKMFVFVMIEAIMLGELLRAEASATSIRLRNAGAANRCCCDPRRTTESAEKAPATLRLISSGSVYAITARPMMPLLRTRAEGASERTEARSGSGVRRGRGRVRTGGVDSRAERGRAWLVWLSPPQPTHARWACARASDACGREPLERDVVAVPRLRHSWPLLAGSWALGRSKCQRPPWTSSEQCRRHISDKPLQGWR